MRSTPCHFRIVLHDNIDGRFHAAVAVRCDYVSEIVIHVNSTRYFLPRHVHPNTYPDVHTGFATYPPPSGAIRHTKDLTQHHRAAYHK